MKGLLLLSLAVAVLSTPTTRPSSPEPRRLICGTPNPPSSLRHQLAHAESQQPFLSPRIRKITVNVFAHVITETDSQRPTHTLLEDQMTLISTIYSRYGITLHHINTSYTTSFAWATAREPVIFKEMVPSLRLGTYADLNIFFSSGLTYNAFPPPSHIFGICSLPNMSEAGMPPNPMKEDGCIIALQTMAGYNDPDPIFRCCDKGLTAVHEVGHWFGLFHVFQQDSLGLGHSNICEGNGDFVADTPPQLSPTWGCPAYKDTCIGGGGDSIHNYMDYSDDGCLTELTSGQVMRMNEIYHRYRTQGNGTYSLWRGRTKT